MLVAEIINRKREFRLGINEPKFQLSGITLDIESGLEHSIKLCIARFGGAADEPMTYGHAVEPAMPQGYAARNRAALRLPRIVAHEDLLFGCGDLCAQREARIFNGRKAQRVRVLVIQAPERAPDSSDRSAHISEQHCVEGNGPPLFACAARLVRFTKGEESA